MANGGTDNGFAGGGTGANGATGGASPASGGTANLPAFGGNAGTAGTSSQPHDPCAAFEPLASDLDQSVGVVRMSDAACIGVLLSATQAIMPRNCRSGPASSLSFVTANGLQEFRIESTQETPDTSITVLNLERSVGGVASTVVSLRTPRTGERCRAVWFEGEAQRSGSDVEIQNLDAVSSVARVSEPALRKARPVSGAALLCNGGLSGFVGADVTETFTLARPHWKLLTTNATPKPFTLSTHNPDEFVLYARHTDRALYWAYVGKRAAEGWHKLGDNFASAPVILKEQGLLFARGTDAQIWTSPAPESGTPAWTSLGGHMLSAPAVLADAQGRLHVFALSSTEHACYRRKTALGWEPWVSLGGPFRRTISATIASNDLVVMGMGSDEAAYYKTFGVAADPATSSKWAVVHPGPISGGPQLIPDGDAYEILTLGTPGGRAWFKRWSRTSWNAEPTQGWVNPIFNMNDFAASVRTSDGTRHVVMNGTDGTIAYAKVGPGAGFNDVAWNKITGSFYRGSPSIAVSGDELAVATFKEPEYLIAVLRGTTEAFKPTVEFFAGDFLP